MYTQHLGIIVIIIMTIDLGGGCNIPALGRGPWHSGKIASSLNHVGAMRPEWTEEAKVMQAYLEHIGMSL